MQGSGGSVMVRGVISGNRKESLFHLQSRINSTKYIDMLSEHFLPYLDRNLDNEPILINP